ncbi:MAG: SDR family NAD(P)-dependent oxidoreductase [bacterium]|nr:SDR family NAD(P)-dependent oxidoreductase [bacterium]
MPGRFRGQIALITGASSGIGAELARQLAAEGAVVVVTARRIERLQDLEKEICATGGSALALACDVTRSADLEAVSQKVRERYGRLDIVVANAGFGVGGSFASLSLDDFRRQLETNLFGVIATLQATLSDLTASRGCFVVMGSVAGLVAFPGTTAYGMSKAAVHSLALGLHGELAASGVGVVLLAPGYVDSEIRQVDKNGSHRTDWHDPVPRWVRMRTPVAVGKMVRAIHRRKRLQVITFHGRLVALAGRYFPGTLAWLARRTVAKSRARRENDDR